jgi:putative RecB family exonuclease
MACPLRWHFRYVAGLPEPTVSASLVLGAAVHRAIQRHYEALMLGRRPPPLDELVAGYRDGWREFVDREVRYGRGVDRALLDDQAWRMLAAFRTSPVVRPRGRIIGVETELVGELLPSVPPILARLDLLVDEGKRLAVLDFKTSRARWSTEQLREQSGQLHLYHELAKPLAQGRQVRLEFAVLTKTRVSALDVYEIAADRPSIERTKRVVARVWDAMQAGVVYPNPSSLQCSTCPFRRECDAWSG